MRDAGAGLHVGPPVLDDRRPDRDADVDDLERVAGLLEHADVAGARLLLVVMPLGLLTHDDEVQDVAVWAARALVAATTEALVIISCQYNVKSRYEATVNGNQSSPSVTVNHSGNR